MKKPHRHVWVFSFVQGAAIPYCIKCQKHISKPWWPLWREQNCKDVRKRQLEAQEVEYLINQRKALNGET